MFITARTNRRVSDALKMLPRQPAAALRRDQLDGWGEEDGWGVGALTDRELEVLRLLRSDLSLREIAQELYISHNTIKGYTKSIYRKLEVSSRGEAVYEALSQGIVKLEHDD